MLKNEEIQLKICVIGQERFPRFCRHKWFDNRGLDGGKVNVFNLQERHQVGRFRLATGECSLNRISNGLLEEKNVGKKKRRKDFK